MAAGLVPSDRTALIIAVRLPPPLEKLRRGSIADARQGVPAHVTLLYPFAQAGAIDAALLAEVQRIVARHRVRSLRLVEGRRWPDTVYAAVRPDAGLLALQAELANAFPSLPLYGGAHAFEPHVSILEGDDATAAALELPAWRSLPISVHPAFVDCIVSEDDRWRRRHRFALGDASGAALA